MFDRQNLICHKISRIFLLKCHLRGFRAVHHLRIKQSRYAVTNTAWRDLCDITYTIQKGVKFLYQPLFYENAWMSFSISLISLDTIFEKSSSIFCSSAFEKSDLYTRETTLILSSIVYLSKIGTYEVV